MTAVQLDYTNVFGYYSPADIESVADSNVRNFLVFHNVMNLAAIFVSPLAGLIRLVVSAAMLHFYTQQYPHSEDKTVENVKQFLIAEMFRSGGEILGAGPVFGIVDIVTSLSRYQLLCFAASEKGFRDNIRNQIENGLKEKLEGLTT